MIVKEIKPNSFCFGVIRAIKMISEIIDDENTPKPIYMFGNLVHNQKIVDYFANYITIIKSDFLKHLDEISTGTVVFTAHGISPFIKQKALDKNLFVVDTTCTKVLKVYQNIQAELDKGKEVLIVGNKNHEEVIGYLGISDKVSIFNENTPIKNNTYITNQTTLVYTDVLDIYKSINNKNITISEEICSATRLRQKALIDFIEEALGKLDMIIVVGDKTSNNCNSLYKLAKKYLEKVYLIDDVSGINNIDFTDVRLVGVTAGASTPIMVEKEVIEALNTYSKDTFYKTKLNSKDYIIFK